MCRKKVAKSPSQARTKLMALCARAERSSGDALRLMRSWGVSEEEQQSILRELIAERFIDDRRYAAAFVRDKVRLSGWGGYKISAALARKGISREITSEQIALIDPEQSLERLKQLIARKQRVTTAKSAMLLRDKLLRYGLSQGYDFQSVRAAIDSLDIESSESEESIWL